MCLDGEEEVFHDRREIWRKKLDQMADCACFIVIIYINWTDEGSYP